MIGLCSKKISQIPHLNVFLDSDWALLPTSRPVSAIAGWGSKPTAKKARAEAARRRLPYISLEDGFLRSLGLGAQSPPLSLIVDYTGVYYDCHRPSDLENLLNSSGWETGERIQGARTGIRAILEHNLSKYNHAPEAPPRCLGPDSEKKVLVLDQTLNDMSVTLGGADEQTFQRMLSAVQEENPDASITVKVHPDVICGKKKGYLDRHDLPGNVHLISRDYAPLTLLRQADVVYTVTSQMGFEALLLGKEVHCFGMPFYGGWGLTVDRLASPRRRTRRTVEELFAAAYMLYARYVNPFTGKRCDLHQAVHVLADQRRRNEANRGLSVGIGFSRWKRCLARAYLKSTDGRVRFYRRPRRALNAAEANSGRIVIWASKEPPGLDRACSRRGIELVRMEDGFLRSIGLGSEFNYPFSLVLDRRGVYYDPSRPSSLERILQETEFTDDIMERARDLRRRIVENAITKYNLDTDMDRVFERPKDRPTLLVIGQVEDDASVKQGGCGIHSNQALLRAVRAARKEAFVVYKPHPDVLVGNRAADRNRMRDQADAVATRGSLIHWFERVDEVHTLTSLSGFEALMRGIPVHTYGGPFYAGWGLTTDRAAFPRRTRRLTLDQLVAGTLILYPAYHDWVTGQPCTPEAVVHRLGHPEYPAGLRFQRGLFLGLRNTMRFLHLHKA